MTGLILVLVGLIAGAVCLTQVVQPTQPDRQAAPASDVHRPDMTIPLAVCGAAIFIGGLMVMFGGRGYHVNNNPQVRN